ncbi:hypothetical protein Tco_1136719 [Tanacetum coccineum]
MSSPNHPTSYIEGAFSSNFPDYTPTSPDYFPATLGNISSDFLENSKNNEILPFYNNPYMKDMQTYNAVANKLPKDPISPPAILTPSLLFDPRYFLVPEELLPPKKQIHPPSFSSTTLSNSSRKQALKTKLKEARTQILELQKKHMGQRDKIAFVHFRISDLEMTLEDIQDRHQLYMKNLMGHTS